MKEFLSVASILKPQGIKGEVKALCYTDSPEDLKAFDRVYIGGNCRKLLKVRPAGDHLAYLAVAGVADRNAAELLRGMEIEVRREDIPEPADGRFYIADLLGCLIVTEEGEKLGVLKDIIPAHTDVYEYEKADGGLVMFPAADGVIVDADPAGGRITVNAKRLAQVASEE